MRYFVTGGAGFIGSNLVDRLLADGHAVTVYDNFSTGQREFLEVARRYAAFRLVEADTLDLPALTTAMAGHNFVFHLAANADVSALFAVWDEPAMQAVSAMRARGRTLRRSTPSVMSRTA